MARFRVELGVHVLTFGAPGAKSLWDELLPVEVRQLPWDLACLDELLRDRELLPAIERHWQREAEASSRSARVMGGRRSRWRRLCA